MVLAGRARLITITHLISRLIDRMQAQFSESKRKNEEFRCKIRRGEIEHFFEERRREILRIQDDEEIKKELNTAAKQHDFLARCGLELTGEPKYEWSHCLTKLRKASSFFSGNFDGWLSVGIVNSLTLLFRQQYKHLLLASQASLLLADMTYLSWDSGTDFISKLMEYEIVPNVATLIGDPIYDIKQRLDMMSLLSNIANCDHKAREKSIRDGAGRVLIELGREVLDYSDKNIVYLAKYLGSAVGFLKVLRKPKGLIPPNNTLVLSFISLLGIIFQKEVSNRVNKNALFCLLEILKMEKEIMYSNVFNIPGAIPRLIQLLTCGQSDLRQQAVTAFNYLTYSDSQAITNQLCASGLIDKLLEAYSIPNRLDIFVKTMLMTISNLAVSSDAICELIFSHQIFSCILQQFDNPKHEIVKQVYYCINSIISKLKYNNLQRLIAGTSVLEHLVKGLIDFREHENKTIHDLLGTFVVLIERTQSVYHCHSNPLLDKLERTYNFSGLLDGISGESRNRVTVELIAKLQDMILIAHCEPEAMMCV